MERQKDKMTAGQTETKCQMDRQKDKMTYGLTEIHKERWKGRKRDESTNKELDKRQMERQTDKQIYIQTNGQTDRLLLCFSPHLVCQGKVVLKHLEVVLHFTSSFN